MAILQGARITGSIIATTFIKANGFSGSITASNLYVLGKAGIGTTSPASKLEVYSTSSINTSNYYGLSKYNASLTSNALNAQVGILFSTLSNSGLPANASIHTVPISDYRSGIVSTYSADAFGAGYFYVNQFIPVSSATVTRFAINNDGNDSNNFVNNILGIGLVLLGSYGLYRLFILLDEENNEY